MGSLRWATVSNELRNRVHFRRYSREWQCRITACSQINKMRTISLLTRRFAFPNLRPLERTALYSGANVAQLVEQLIRNQ